MLGLPEYVATSAEIQRLGREFDTKIADALKDCRNKQEAIRIVRGLVPDYQRRYRQILGRTLNEIGDNAVEHYKDKLGDERSTTSISRPLVKQQLTEKYYGTTLEQRLTVNERRLIRIITQTAQTDQSDKEGNYTWKNLSGVFSQRVPFGAQVNLDKRILQGTAIKVEQDVATKMAKDNEIPLIKWNLAAGHKSPCECEEYAVAIDPDVVKYLEQTKSPLNPKGIYFTDKLPRPPHPNCQCEFGMVGRTSKTATGIVKRTLQKVTKLLRRLRGR